MFSHFGSSLGSDVDFTPSGWLGGGKIGGSIRGYDEIQNFLFFETSRGMMHLGGIEATVTISVSKPQNTSRYFYLSEKVFKDDGTFDHWRSIKIDRLQKADLVYFHEYNVIFDNTSGLRGTNPTINDVLSARPVDLISKTAYLNIDGTDGNDILRLHEPGGGVWAGKGDDKLIGSHSDDKLSGQDGNDTIESGNGKDFIEGAAGNDRFILGLGEKYVFGDKEFDSLDFNEFEEDGDYDTVNLKGSPDQYKISVKQPDSPKLATLITSVSGNNLYALEGVEKLTFEKAAQNVVALKGGGWVTETALQMVKVYDKDNPTSGMSMLWHRVQAIELGMDPADKKYTMADGVFRDGTKGFFSGDAVATVNLGVADGKRTLSVAFKGSDDLKDWSADLTFDMKALKSYYTRFEPLATAIKDFLHEARNGIAQVIVTGHSLGGAMTQYFVSDLVESNAPQKIWGYTYGSIGAKAGETLGADGRLTNFVHVGDMADALGLWPWNAERSSGLVTLNSKFAMTRWGLHYKEGYQQDINLLMQYASRTDGKWGGFYKTDLAQKLLGNGWRSGEIQVAIGSENSEWLSLTSEDFYAIGHSGNDHFDLGALNPQYFKDTVAGSEGRTINGGSGKFDTVSLASSFGSYARTITKDGSLKITRASDGKVIAIIENSVERIMYGFDLREFDGSKVLSKSYSGASNVTLKGDGVYAKIGSGSGKVTGSQGDDTIIAGTGNKTILGGAGNDYIQIDGGTAKSVKTKHDTVFIDGGTGADTMVGGAGNETYIVENTGDRIVDRGGVDTVESSVNYGLAKGTENLALTGKAIQGSGNELNNIIEGTSRANKLMGYGGNDTLDGKAGADTLSGGEGNDTYIVDSAQDNVIENAKEGKDLVKTSISYTVATNVENLTLTGSKTINGTGNSLDNKIIGNSAANTLEGGNGNDLLKGGGGADKLYGGAGTDRLYGGAGADLFVFTSTRDSTASSRDMIYDFLQKQGDRIHLSGIDARSSTNKNDTFTFIGEKAFSDKAGELRYFHKSGDTFVSGDVNGDGKADFALRLDKTIDLVKGDFIL
ncbi:hypothetical protein GB928_004260 [Shinella curvata]|uniref:Ca2+-binding RTX toxin-like protein n=1 Tax=Shinella curvata TaxID=1817964 RepID=A0ABT8X9H5_9HYPH|nr:hypothetical protein [Shinella curvata]MCJ8051663.1 hypothetical protein [Shinella curvata]MDO6120389.1 hypothetical protein [Shinella curvata]